MYPGHLPVRPLSRVLASAVAAVRSVRDPRRATMVAKLGELTGHYPLARLRDGMRACPEGAALLARRPEIGAETLEAARAAPAGSLGAAYAAFMADHDFDPEARSGVSLVDDPELAYVMTRYRQVHDFWHVLAGLPPTVLGELGLKCFEMVHLRLPVSALSALAGPAALGAADRRVYRQAYVPWAVRAAREAKPLMAVEYEARLDADLSDLRRELRVRVAPPAVVR